MADHAAAVSELTRTLPKQFYLKSSLFGYSHSVPDLIFLLALAAGIGFLPMPMKCLCAVGIAVIGYRITFIMHDCSHGTLFSRKGENEFLGWLASSFLFTSFPSFRRLHLIHHKHYCRELDPQGPDYRGLDPTRDRVLWHLAKPLFLFNAIEKAANLFALRQCGMTQEELKGKDNEVQDAMVKGSAAAALSILAAQVVIFTLSTGWFRFLWGYLFFVAPLVTIGLFLSRVRSYLEHGDLTGGTGSANLIARTHCSNIVEANVMCAISFNYHFEHHRWPQVPSRFLKEVHRTVTAGHIPENQVEESYFASLKRLAETAMFHGSKR